MQFFTSEDICAALALPPVPDKAETARRVCADGLVQKVAMELAVQSFVLDAVKEICKSNHAREMLLKRVGAVGITKPVFHPALWNVGRGTVSGRPRIDANCEHCKQTFILIAPETGDSGTGPMGRVTLADVDNALALTFAHCGRAEEIPAPIRDVAKGLFMKWGQLE